MKNILATALLVTFIIVAPVGAAPIKNLENLAIPARSDGTRFTLDEVRALIMQGCTRREWKPDDEGNSRITCSILVRGRHYVKVDIPFNEDDYSILYLDSEEMNYNEAKQSIHRKYNGWVNNLYMMIDWQFRDAAEKPVGEPVVEKSSSAAESNRYDALLKLGELREKGLISEEEFEAEKQKLLGEGK
jgi:hypothetical protein